MASQLYKQFLYSNNAMLSMIEGSFKVGASGNVAPSTAIVGTGVSSVTKTGTGQYQIQLTQNFNRFLGFDATVLSPSSAAGSVADGSFVVGQPYQIVFASTSTNWQTVGLGTGLTAAQGMPFVATSGNSGGNGTAVALGVSGVNMVEVLPNPNSVLQSSEPGGYVNIQTLNGSNAPVSPSSGTVIRFNIFLRNSSLLGTNENSSNY